MLAGDQRRGLRWAGVFLRRDWRGLGQVWRVRGNRGVRNYMWCQVWGWQGLEGSLRCVWSAIVGPVIGENGNRVLELRVF